METASFKTKLGWITVKKKSGRVFSLSFGKTNKTIDLINIKNQINLYASGKLKNFKINYSFEGSPLQKKIWKELSKILIFRTPISGGLDLITLPPRISPKN